MMEDDNCSYPSPEFPTISIPLLKPLDVGTLGAIYFTKEEENLDASIDCLESDPDLKISAAPISGHKQFRMITFHCLFFNNSL